MITTFKPKAVKTNSVHADLRLSSAKKTKRRPPPGAESHKISRRRRLERLLVGEGYQEAAPEIMSSVYGGFTGRGPRQKEAARTDGLQQGSSGWRLCAVYQRGTKLTQRLDIAAGKHSLSINKNRLGRKLCGNWRVGFGRSIYRHVYEIVKSGIWSVCAYCLICLLFQTSTHQ